MKEVKITQYIKNNEIDLEKIISDYSAYIGTIIDNMSKLNIKEQDKEEIISDVIFILWKNKFKIDKNKLLSPYIAGITKNVVKNYLRSINRFSNQFNIEDYENSLQSFNEFDILDENFQKIKTFEKILGNLKKLDKEIFLDHYYNSKSIKDIAKEQKISEFNIKQRLYRIRKKIKKEGNYYE